MKGSYEMRCEAAAISYNNAGEYFGKIHKSAVNKSPGKYTKKFTSERVASREYNKNYKRNFLRKACRPLALPDNDYGPDAQIPDMLPEVYEEMAKNFLNKISCSADDILNIERETVGQSNNSKWKEQRLQRLTASWFGKICKQKKTTSCANTIKSILYSTFAGNAATKYGIEKEPLARQEFEEKTKLKVEECGLFVDGELNFLAASPDGTVNHDRLVEIKCPASAQNLTPQDAIREKKITFAALIGNKTSLKKSHDYYYQVQGQLHISQKNCCYFIIWTPLGMTIEKIYKDDQFWTDNMVAQLKEFYMKGMLPEIIDPRHNRGMPIRNFTKSNK